MFFLELPVAVVICYLHLFVPHQIHTDRHDTDKNTIKTGPWATRGGRQMSPMHVVCVKLVVNAKSSKLIMEIELCKSYLVQ